MIRANFHFAETSKVLWCTCTLVLLLALVFPKPTRAQTDNTAYGTGALGSNTTGDYNSAFGFDALLPTGGGTTRGLVTSRFIQPDWQPTIPLSEVKPSIQQI